MARRGGGGTTPSKQPKTTNYKTRTPLKNFEPAYLGEYTRGPLQHDVVRAAIIEEMETVDAYVWDISDSDSVLQGPRFLIHAKLQRVREIVATGNFWRYDPIHNHSAWDESPHLQQFCDVKDIRTTFPTMNLSATVSATSMRVQKMLNAELEFLRRRP